MAGNVEEKDCNFLHVFSFVQPPYACATRELNLKKKQSILHFVNNGIFAVFSFQLRPVYAYCEAEDLKELNRHIYADRHCVVKLDFYLQKS